MESAKSIDSLTWSEDPRSLCDVLEKYKVPNLVRIQQKHHGIDDASTLEAGQLLMLHALRTKQNFIGKDSIGRPIAIPVRYKRKLFVCPSSLNCGSEPMFVPEISNVYPSVKFFRVIQNTRDEGEGNYFELGSIAEVDHIDETNLAVKFKDVEHPLSFSCCIAFEALLDYRAYSLKEAVKAFGLPIKVRFLSGGNELDNDFEDDLENLGKVTISRKSKCEFEVFASKIDANVLTLPKSPVKCSLISKNCKINVYVAKKIVEKDLAYKKMLRHYNSEFLDKYDLKELDNFDKCQYLDRADENPKPEITGFVLETNIPDEYENIPGTPGFTPAPTISTAQTCDSLPQIEYIEVIDQEAETGEYHDRILKPDEEDDYESPIDDHVYESISDEDRSRDDDDYELVSDDVPESENKPPETQIQNTAGNENTAPIGRNTTALNNVRSIPEDKNRCILQ